MSTNAESFIKASFVALIANTALLGGILYCVWLRPPATKQIAYEYAMESCSDSSLDFTLNMRGQAGWQVASARRAVGSDGNGRYEFTFYRPVTDQKDDGIRQAEFKISQLKLERTIARMNAEQRLKDLQGK